MDHSDTTGNDLDLHIDLESGVTCNRKDDTIKSQIRNGFMNLESESGSKSDGDCSYKRLAIFDEVSQIGKHVEYKKMGFVNKASKYGRPFKPPRHPKGPSLNAYDMKLMKEINVLNLKPKRASRKIRKEKASSWAGNILASLVTIVFLLVIIFPRNE